jgi:predicted nucleic acid-binding protein
MRTVLDINVIVAGLVSEGLCHEVLESHLPGHTPTPSSILSDESIKTIPLHS